MLFFKELTFKELQELNKPAFWFYFIPDMPRFLITAVWWLCLTEKFCLEFSRGSLMEANAEPSTQSGHLAQG